MYILHHKKYLSFGRLMGFEIDNEGIITNKRRGSCNVFKENRNCDFYQGGY